MGDIEITQYAPSASGARAVEIRMDDGLSVLVRPTISEENGRAKLLAQSIAAVEQFRTDAEAAVHEQKLFNAELARQLRQARARVAELERINEAAITGRRRFFGPVLMKPAKTGDWSGAVWLLDPDKLDSGLGIFFASVADVHALHPELWVVNVTADGVLLDASGKDR